MVSAYNAPNSNELALPVWNIQTFHSHTLALAGAVDERAIAGIDACVQPARTVARAKNNNIARPGVRCGHSLASLCLVSGDSGHLDAMLAVGPPDESGTVKTLLRRGPPETVLFAHLAVGRFDYFMRLGQGRTGISGFVSEKAAAAKYKRQKQWQTSPKMKAYRKRTAHDIFTWARGTQGETHP